MAVLRGESVIINLKLPIDFDSLVILLLLLMIDVNAKHLIISSFFLEFSNGLSNLRGHYRLFAHFIGWIHVPLVRDRTAFELLKLSVMITKKKTKKDGKEQKGRKTHNIISELLLAHI